MSGSRAARLVAKEGELFLYTNALGMRPGARTPFSACTTATPGT